MGKKHKHISITVCIILFLLLTTMFFYISITVANEIPSVMEYDRSRLSSGITFATYEKLTSKSYKEDLSVYAELDPVILDGIGEVKPVLVNENYFEVYGVHVGGSGITDQHILNCTPALVISDKAAMSMSLDGNVIGKQITLYDKDFTIVGIYKKPDGFLREISSDIYDRVYIPYTCYDNYAKISIDSLAATKGTYSEKALPLLGLTETDANIYIENDLAIKHDIIANFPNLLIFVFTLILSVTIIRIIRRMVKQTYHKLHEDYQNNNLSVVLRHNWLYILSCVLIAVLMIAIPTTLLILFPPKLIIPPNYIPFNNIFDLKHYIEVFTSHMQQFNANLPCGNNFYLHLFSNSMVLLTSSFVIIMLWATTIKSTKTNIEILRKNDAVYR
jgi:hypothetical protein